MANDDWLNGPIKVIQTPQQHPTGAPWETVVRVLPWVLLVGVIGWFVIRGQHGSEPIGVEGLRVLVVEESADRGDLTADQIAIFNSVEIREAVTAADGQMLVLDADDDTRKLLPEWQALRNRIRSRPPVVVIANPRRAKEMPLPADVPEFLKEFEGFAK
jgi:hypothetical protein